jgi:hypothetical protein
MASFGRKPSLEQKMNKNLQSLNSNESISLSDLLKNANEQLGFPSEGFLVRVRLVAEWLYSQEVLPTRRSSQHYETHHHFAATLILWVDGQLVVDMTRCRSTTYLAGLGSANTAQWLDRLVRKGFLESDSSKHKAENNVSVTPRLLAAIPSFFFEGAA